MYSFTHMENQEVNKANLFILCECGRMFIQEEMYSCLKCEKSVCRYCCSQQIEQTYCRYCLEYNYYEYNYQVTTKCTSCVQCPRCKSLIQEPTLQKDKKMHFSCKFCFWNSKTIMLEQEVKEDLFLKVSNKIKNHVDPNQNEYLRIQQLYKDSQQEIEKRNKLQVRIKRKSISLILPSMKFRKHEKKTFTLGDFEQYMEEQINFVKEKQEIVEKPKLRSFSLIQQKDKYDLFTPNAIYNDFYKEDYPSLDEALSKKVEFERLTDVDQRFFNQWNQPALIKDLFPKQMQLSARRSRKCNSCQDYIIKPISKSNLTYFQIKQFHIEVTPKLRYRRREEMGGNKQKAIVYAYNESEYTMVFEFQQLEEDIASKYNLKEVAFDKTNITLQPKESKNLIVERITYTISVPQNTRDAVSFGFYIDLNISTAASDKTHHLKYIVIIETEKIVKSIKQ